MDTGNAKGCYAGGGGGADEEGSDGEGLEGHEVGVAAVALSENPDAPP